MVGECLQKLDANLNFAHCLLDMKRVQTVALGGGESCKLHQLAAVMVNRAKAFELEGFQVVTLEC